MHFCGIYRWLEVKARFFPTRFVSYSARLGGHILCQILACLSDRHFAILDIINLELVKVLAVELVEFGIKSSQVEFII